MASFLEPKRVDFAGLAPGLVGGKLAGSHGLSGVSIVFIESVYGQPKFAK